jgi:ATP-dependent helicase HepA
MAGLQVGDFVMRRSAEDIGRVGAIDDEVRVDYFESVAQPIAYSLHENRQNLQVVLLPIGARVFWLDPDTAEWAAGRVLAKFEDATYVVQFPSARNGLRVAGRDLRVRWNRPVSNPLHVLSVGGCESPYFYGARIPMLRSLIRQRASSASTSAFLSSAVEVYPHQIRAALNVLSDPVQRYLLADEVGLGKTIEAGYIIRQTLIDNPTSRIVILTPDSLRRQWLRELSEKFFTDDFPKARIKILAHERPDSWTPYTQNDLVVVDEAHSLVGLDAPNGSPYPELAVLAHNAQRLLLLSATPVTSNLTTHLGLLHLLDPDLYKWTEVEVFTKRYALRSELADVAYALDPSWDTTLLPINIDRIRALLPEDERLSKLAERVLALLDDDGDLLDEVDKVELTLRVEELRGHISETYRLHRRTIRHRRSSVLQDDPNADFLPYEVRGRVRPTPLHISSEVGTKVEDLLQEWRSVVRDALIDMGRAVEDHAYAAAFAVLLGRAAGGSDDLADAMTWRLDRVGGDRSGLDDRERAMLASAPVLPHERGILERICEISAGSNESWLHALQEVLTKVVSKHQRTVVFCGPGMLADELAAALRAKYPKAAIHQHTSSNSSELREQAVHAWSSGDIRGLSLLVADDSAEDGLNLQTADAVVHLRLPWSPNRLEQRLGRVDRFPGTSARADRTPSAQYVVLPSTDEDSTSAAWLALLSDGYRIFDASLSTLQDALAVGLPNVWAAALAHGPDGLDSMTEKVALDLRDSGIEIDKMDMLESIHEKDGQVFDIATAIGELETDWRQIAGAVMRYTDKKNGGINIRRRVEPVRNDNVVTFKVAESEPAVDPRLLRVEKGAYGEGSPRGVFNRTLALQMPGTRLFRIGNPIVEMLANVVEGDDRGQAVGFWRRDPHHGGAPVLYFGFDFAIEADLAPAAELLTDSQQSTKALRRQADRLFPPFMTKTWVTTIGLELVIDPRQVDWLDQPYDVHRDHNVQLSGFDDLVAVVGGHANFRRTGEQAEVVARTSLHKSGELVERREAALAVAGQTLRVYQAQAKARAAAGRLVDDGESMILDSNITRALIEGISDPVVRVVAATCIGRKGIRHG